MADPAPPREARADGLEPGLTVVIPYWDLEPGLLLDAVGSVAEQGEAYRTIVVDNASAVPLPELPGFAEVLHLPERVNVGEARNAGLALVRTSHVLFLDADDALFPGSIRFLSSQLEAVPEAVASVGAGALYRRGIGFVPFRPSRRRRLLHIRRLQHRPLLLALVNTVYMIVPTSCVLLRTDVVRRAGGFSSDPAEEDWVLSSRLPFHGRIVAGRERVRRYGLRPSSLNQLKAEDWRISARARRELRRRLRRDPAVPLPVRLALPPLLVLLHSKPALRRVRARLERALGRPPRVVERRGSR